MRKDKKSNPKISSSSYGPDEYWEKLETGTDYRKKCRMTWAALIKCVYEVDPLKCPVCGGTMKIISFIEKRQSDVIERILRHCNLWKEIPPRAPPCEEPDLEPAPELTVDYDFFGSLAS